MSKFSGKCDFADIIEIHGVDKIVHNSDIYVADNILPLKIESEKDLIPYYPYTVRITSSCKDKMYIRLSSRSYIDVHEDEMKTFYLNSLMTKYNTAKKKHKENEALDVPRNSFITYNEQEIYKIIQEKKGKVTLEDLEEIHEPMAEHYRKALCEEMIRAGWNETQAQSWCFGFMRIVRKNIPKLW